MKIAYIVVKGIPMSGGIEKYTEELANKLVEHGHEVTVYTTKHYGNVTGSYGGFHIKTVPSFKGKFFEKISLVMMASFDQMFRDYNIVHYHALGPSIFSFMAKLCGKKVVIQSHGIEYQRAKWGRFTSSMLRLMEQLSYNMGDELTVVSKQIEYYFRDIYGKEAVYIPTGIEMPDISVWNEALLCDMGLEENEYYLFIARIVEEKGLHYLIEAYKHLETTKKLVIAGKIDTNNPYHQKIMRMLKGDERIVFAGEILGEKKDMLFKGAYAFCLPSELEGMSIALLEAMSYGKLCIVSNIAENMDVAQGKTLTFENKNVENLSEVLRKAETMSDAERKCYGNMAKTYVEKNHQFEMIAQQMEELYNSLLN